MATEIPPDLCEIAMSGSTGQISSFSPQTWKNLHQNVVERRKMITALASRVPTAFRFRTVETETGPKTRLYFLGMAPKCRENTILYIDLMCENSEDPALQVLSWQNLLESFQSTVPVSQLSREEQLMRERKRMGIYGITSYELVEKEGLFVFPASNSLFMCHDANVQSTEPVSPVSIVTDVRGARLDPKICPTNSSLLAFIHRNDIWVTNLQSSSESQLTFANKGGSTLTEEPLSAGVASFVVQEEFDRYTGYWWCPAISPHDSTLFQILYEEVDESEVEILNIFAPSAEGNSVDEYRYPRAGTSNAKSVLKLVQFRVGENGEIQDIEHLQLYEPLSTFFPWMEYMVRAGWTPDAKFVYAEILNRQQTHICLVLIPVGFFVTYTDDDMEMNSVHKRVPSISVIYEEKSDIWINTHDILYFFQHPVDSEVRFLWSSEETGFRHLYCVTSKLNSCDNSSLCAMDLLDENIYENCKANVISKEVLTSGDWEVLGKQIWVDEVAEVVYFMGLKDTVLETHLYAVSYTMPSEPVRLTALGFSHTISFSQDCSMFVSVYSSVKETTACSVFKIVNQSKGHVGAKNMAVIMPSVACSEYQAPELFEYQGVSGHTHHGLFFRPHNSQQDRVYPTVLMVYGGPQVQQVTNSFKGIRFLRHHALASNGYAVVVIDGRGSCGRGLKFESHIKDRLGTVEIEDQVEGLKWLISSGFPVDMNRIAIHGWSYGGYLSLLGLAQRPNIFKVAIAGAPVVNWRLYDTGYTERYLNTPDKNEKGYQEGSVLTHVEKFPDEENRLLIIHGLIDENVHFHHTSTLINALVKACKPYRLQIYPNERHGIRNHEASEHYKTMILSFLQNNL